MSKAHRSHALTGLVDRLGQSPTIGEKYASAGFRPTGFDYLRISLAISILLWHSILVCHAENWASLVVNTQWKVPLLFLVPAFFSLSGFLIAGSLERSTIPTFIGLRILRIVPALTVDTLITVFILGPIFTILPLQQYFSTKETGTYLLNIAGDIHYRLPGVFVHNPIGQIINAQLWTIPWEFVCYVTIVLLAIVGIAKSRIWFLVVSVAVPLVLLVGLTIVYPRRFAPNPHLIAPHSISIVLCFLIGIAIHKYREMIPHNSTIALAAIFGYIIARNTEYSGVVGPLFVSYITIWVGVTNFHKTVIIKGGDYSYGIYLYHCTIQQALVSVGILKWYGVFPTSAALAVAVAALSWHFVEKPALSFRRYLTKQPGARPVKSVEAESRWAMSSPST